MKPAEKLKQHWFVIGLGGVFLITLGDVTETVSSLGATLRFHHGPELTIILIFLFSGMMLDAGQIKSGITDLTGLLLALALIFIVSPAAAGLIGLMPIPMEIKVGIFLVAAMPSTLSSGVVMTGAAGGNMAHALLITITANSLSVASIPIILSGLLAGVGGGTAVTVDKLPIMMKIGAMVLFPLISGIAVRRFNESAVARIDRRLNIVNQSLILCIVWMSLSHSRNVIADSLDMLSPVVATVAVFHLALMMTALTIVKHLNIEAGRRESVVFMGIQKTLPLSVILQLSLFPQLGLVLVVCVVHHIVHLMMDGFLVGRFRKAK